MLFILVLHLHILVFMNLWHFELDRWLLFLFGCLKLLHLFNLLIFVFIFLCILRLFHILLLVRLNILFFLLSLGFVVVECQPPNIPRFHIQIHCHISFQILQLTYFNSLAQKFPLVVNLQREGVSALVRERLWVLILTLLLIIYARRVIDLYPLLLLSLNSNSQESCTLASLVVGVGGVVGGAEMKRR